MLSLLFKRASEDSELKDYIFQGFMTGQPVLAIKMPDEFSYLLRQKSPHLLLRNLPKNKISLLQALLLGAKWVIGLMPRMVVQATATDVLLPGAWFLGLSSISVFYPEGGDLVLQLALVVGTGISIFFLHRKERKFCRAVLFTLVSLIIGLIAGGLIAGWLLPQTPFLNLSSNQFSTVVTFILLWLVSSFLY
ncbi:CPP1-like family protein (plasmid) [Nostoc edaphicum CCNP1411]|uniref:CPP1-like family protein n=1 Tax=Nostoc edaphicum CCNP1411 TaxID=1472755 RepID=A0A7D7L9J5_9NOSO|nr:CPP1-like family protein [Nostoc edaphicum CCNP1411]